MLRKLQFRHSRDFTNATSLVLATQQPQSRTDDLAVDYGNLDKWSNNIILRIAYLSDQTFY